MMGRDMRAMDPVEVLYWGVMSAGIIAGFIAAYPVNVWLVSANLKHGLMTVRAGPSGGPPLGAAQPAHGHGAAS
jgi:Sec-independent protein secretion pathway component TatC